MQPHRLRLAGIAMLLALVACADSPAAPDARSRTGVPQRQTSLGPASSFAESFSSPILDPAWVVVTPGRVIAPLALPPNHFSLTERPGYLRYMIDPWTHHDGFFNGFAPTFGEHSCCAHNAGLELQRTFSGTHWRLETKVDFHMPFANGRALELRVYLGDGGVGTLAVAVGRGRDVNINRIHTQLRQQNGTTVSSVVSLKFAEEEFGVFDGPANTAWFRIERIGTQLSASWSLDGSTWTQDWLYDAGSSLTATEQTVVLSGLMWSFLPLSYADWDYVNVAPSQIPVTIDIKPGSAANSVNPRLHGVLPVAVLTTTLFDAATLNPLTIRFGATGVEVTPTHVATEDVDGDADLDLILHFPVRGSGIVCGATAATLTGATLTGQPVLASDTIVTVGCR